MKSYFAKYRFNDKFEPIYLFVNNLSSKNSINFCDYSHLMTRKALTIANFAELRRKKVYRMVYLSVYYVAYIVSCSIIGESCGVPCSQESLFAPLLMKQLKILDLRQRGETTRRHPSRPTFHTKVLPTSTVACYS